MRMTHFDQKWVVFGPPPEVMTIQFENDPFWSQVGLSWATRGQSIWKWPILIKSGSFFERPPEITKIRYVRTFLKRNLRADWCEFNNLLWDSPGRRPMGGGSREEADTGRPTDRVVISQLWCKPWVDYTKTRYWSKIELRPNYDRIKVETRSNQENVKCEKSLNQDWIKIELRLNQD